MCSNCNIKGCGCDQYQCGCPPLKDKDRKNYEHRIQASLAASKLDRREYTEYYKYCPKCVV
jgi:hypothetical protein